MLHDLLAAVAAPTVVLSWPDGDFDVGSDVTAAAGMFHADVRVLSRIRLTLDDRCPTLLRSAASGGTARFVALARWLGDPGADGAVRVDRVRTVTPGRVAERIVVTATGEHPVRTTLGVALACDLATLRQIRSGVSASRKPDAREEDSEMVWRGHDLTVSARAGQGGRLDTGQARLTWPLSLEPRASVAVDWEVCVDDPGAPFGSPTTRPTWRAPRVGSADRRLSALLAQSLTDLQALRLSDPAAPEDHFLAAGVPWFLTLFGRDSLWAARSLLPLGTDLARGTLRVLARRQGMHEDRARDESPGKILHEVRRSDETALSGGGKGLGLPPVYYGTVDATPLWICLLHDAWRWGLAPADVEPLLPTLDRALAWMATTVEAGQGLLSHVDHGQGGLTNHGWKDSEDAVRFRDGRWARPPIALAEVQAYAHQAARGAADLLAAFERPGAEEWRAWAGRLAARFRDLFWVEDDAGPYPAMAMDGSGRPVDALASNIGHLLASGMLDPAESALVAARITAPDMAAGYGLRTMSSAAGGFSSLSYHCGSVWPHDTVVAILGLVRSGHADRAAGLVNSLLHAAESFAWRLPELWGGDDRGDLPAPVPYPDACRPQAWAAAASVGLLTAILGLDPDVPAGRLVLRPMTPSPLGALTVRGLQVGAKPLDVDIDPAGRVSGLRCSPRLRVEPEVR
jgi:glycogen debranching enzyme